MSDAIREAYDARRLLMQRLNAILDDRWPLAGKIMAAVDEYAEARSIPAEALDVLRAIVHSENDAELDRAMKAAHKYVGTLPLSPHNGEADSLSTDTLPALPVDERPCSVECCDAQERRHIHEGADR